MKRTEKLNASLRTALKTTFESLKNMQVRMKKAEESRTKVREGMEKMLREESRKDEETMEELKKIFRERMEEPIEEGHGGIEEDEERRRRRARALKFVFVFGCLI